MLIKIQNFLSIILVSLLLCNVNNSYAEKIYKRVDKYGNVTYTNTPETTKEVEEQTEFSKKRRAKAKINKLNREYRYKGDRKFTQKKVDEITQNYLQRKQAVKKVMDQMEHHCGKEQSIQSFNDGDEARTRYLDWEKCSRQFESELKKKNKQLRAAKRKYLIVK